MDPTKTKSKTAYQHNGTFYSVALDPAGPRIFAGSDDYAIHVFDFSASKKEAVARWLKHDNYVSSLVTMQRGSHRLAISGSYDRSLVWWDSVTGKVVRAATAHDGWIRSVVPSPDGSRLFSAGDDMMVKVWDTDSGRLIRSLNGHAQQTPQGHQTALYAIAVSPDGRHVASGDRIGEVIVWEVDTGKTLLQFQTPILYTYDVRQRKRSIGGIRALAFSRDGTTLAVGGIGQVGNVDGLAGPAHVELWDWRKPQLKFAAGVQAHKGIINHLQFHPNGDWLIGAGGGSDDGFLACWKTNVAQETKEPAVAHRIKTNGHIHDFCLNAAGTDLYAAGYKKLEVWSLAAS